MMFLTRLFVIILTFCLATRPARAGDLSPNLQDFLSTANGTWNNSVLAIKVRLTPVVQPHLSEEQLLLLEQSLNGVIERLDLCEITENNDGIIYVKKFNFSKLSQHEPGEFKVDDLSNIARADLRYIGCTMNVSRLGEGAYKADWTHCSRKDTVVGPFYTFYAWVTRDDFTVFATLKILVELLGPSPLIPVKLERIDPDLQ